MYIKAKQGRNTLYYLAEMVKTGGRWKEKLIRRATEEEVRTHKASRGEQDLAQVTCANPDCDKTFLIPRIQKRNFLLTYPHRYGTLRLPCCSTRCQKEYADALNRVAKN